MDKYEYFNDYLHIRMGIEAGRLFYDPFLSGSSYLPGKGGMGICRNDRDDSGSRDVFDEKKPQNRVFYVKEGFVSVALSWIVMSAVGSVPFVISDSIKIQ